MTSLLPTIGALLHEDGRLTKLAWDDLLLHRNSSPLPSPYPGNDTLWNRGFDFLVLDAGRPTHFGRCRARADLRAGRACDIRARLSAVPELARLVPRTRLAMDGDFLVEISSYLRGTQFQREVTRLGSEALARDARRIIAANRRITREAEQRIPTLRSDLTRLDLGQAAAPALRYLAQAGLPSGHGEMLGAALSAAGAVAPRAQHGDLWPANVLRCGEELLVLDFEVLGEVHVPLFDVFHFLRSCLIYRNPPVGSRTVFAILESGDRDVTTWREIVAEEAAQDGLTRGQTIGAFVYYLVEMTATIRRRDGPESHWGPYWRCVAALVDRLRSGAALDELLMGPPRP